VHTQKTLQALAACQRLEDCVFYFFADAAKTEQAQAQVDETREVLKQWADRFEATIIERSENFGLAKSIVTGVTELCQQYGQVIVLEDDLIVANDFLHYMLESLKHYQHSEQVVQVSGFTISPPASLDSDVFLLPITTTWGWATWQRAWQHFSWTADDLEQAQQDSQWRQLFDVNGSCNFSAMLSDRLNKRNDSWGILWWYAVSRLNGLVAYPRESLVWNGGFDGSGVHCGDSEFGDKNLLTQLNKVNMSGSVQFPQEIVYDESHFNHLAQFFSAQNGYGVAKKSGKGVLQNILKQIKNMIRKR